jgi:hypothetical protein
MFKQKRLIVLSMAVLLALLVAAVLPFAALANDGTPPPPDIPVVEETSADVPVAEEPAVGEPVAEEPSADVPVSEEPAVEVPVAEEPPAEVPVVDEPLADAPVVDELPTEVPALDETLTVPEILEAAPEGTELVVLDVNGEALPLASEAALANVFTGDPMWCPTGVLPGGDGCTKSFTKFNGEGGLIDVLETQKATYFGAGTIYVESTYNATTAGDTTDNFIFISSFMGLTDLVFQGGWDFASNSVVGTSTFDLGADKQLTFLWEAGNLTLKDINVTNSGGLMIGNFGALTVAPAPATTTNVTLDNVSVTNSGFATIFTTGDVTVTDSDFNNNKEGLIAFTEKGDVTVTNSVFNNNAGGLASGSGLLVMTGEGDITLENVTATGNGFGGEDTLLQSSSSDPFGFYGSGILLMTGEMSATELTASMTGGNITLNNVIASGNFGNGVVIVSGSDVSVTCSTFENNGGYGVLSSLPGVLTIDSNVFSDNASGDIYMEGGMRVDKSSGCGEEEGRRKNKDIGPFIPQVIAVITPLTLDELPGALPEGKTFVAGMSVKLMLGSEEIDEWPAGVQASFDTPAGTEPGRSFTVLFWNGTEWVEVPSAIVDGKVVFSITEPGVYVLVSP